MDRKRVYLEVYRDTYHFLKEIVSTKERLQILVNRFP